MERIIGRCGLVCFLEKECDEEHIPSVTSGNDPDCGLEEDVLRGETSSTKGREKEMGQVRIRQQIRKFAIGAVVAGALSIAAEPVCYAGAHESGNGSWGIIPLLRQAATREA